MDTGGSELKRFVGNLSWTTNDEALLAHFQAAGHNLASFSVLMMPDGRSKGAAIVSFNTSEEGTTKLTLCQVL